MSEAQKISPDFSFMRDGVPIVDALRHLVSEDPSIRKRAGEQLQAMQMGLPSVHTDFATVDLAALSAGNAEQPARFSAAIRDAVTTLDVADFVRRIVAYKMALNDDWSRRCDLASRRQEQVDAKFDRLSSSVVEKIKTSANPIEKSKVSHQLERIIAAYLCTVVGAFGKADDPMSGAEVMSSPGVMAAAVIGALSNEILAAPDAVYVLLNNRQLAYLANAALERCGLAAIQFAPYFIDQIDSLPTRRVTDPHVYFGGTLALAAIGRDDPEIVGALVERLTHSDEGVRNAVTLTICAMDGAVAGRQGEIVEKLLKNSHPDFGPDVAALASVGRRDPAVRKFIVETIRPRPAIMRSTPDFPDYSYDFVMHQCGRAIDATKYLTDYPDEFVEPLIDALRTFEEYDPDESYGGDHARVAGAIARFGHAAAAAVMPLAHLLKPEDDCESTKGIIGALIDIGPAAREALPLLEAYRQAQNPDTPMPDLTRKPIDLYDDPIAAAMQKISGIAS